MKKLYSALLVTVFMPYAALAQDATTPAPETPPAAQEQPAPAPESGGADASQDTTTTTVPMEGAEGTSGADTGTPPSTETAQPSTETAPADSSAAQPTDTGEAAPADSGTTTAPADTTAMPSGGSDTTTTTTTETPPAEETTTMEAAPVEEESSAAAEIEGPFVTVPLTGAWRVSDLEGKDVYDANGENIGEITDVLVAEEGEVIAVLVGVGGFLGIGEKDVAVSMQSLEFGPGAMEGLPTEAEAEAAQTPPAGGAAGTADPAAGGAAPGAAPAPAEPVTPVVGEDNLPDRIVLNVTREELEAAPAYEDVEAGTATEGGDAAAPDAAGGAMTPPPPTAQ